jgi:hypothetical protein
LGPAAHISCLQAQRATQTRWWKRAPRCPIVLQCLRQPGGSQRWLHPPLPLGHVLHLLHKPPFLWTNVIQQALWNLHTTRAVLAATKLPMDHLWVNEQVMSSFMLSVKFSFFFKIYFYFFLSYYFLSIILFLFEFIQSFVHSLFKSYAFICSFIYFFIHAFIHIFIYAFICYWHI